MHTNYRRIIAVKSTSYRVDDLDFSIILSKTGNLYAVLGIIPPLQSPIPLKLLLTPRPVGDYLSFLDKYTQRRISVFSVLV